MRFQRSLATIILAFAASTSFAAAPPAKITDLSWMTGTWSAPVGANTLEENWTTASSGSIAAMVRMSGAKGVSMWEVITIEEKNGSLAMSVQQWNAGFEERTPVAQKLELMEIDDKRVKFKAITEGSMTTLAYSRGADGTFNIEMGTPAGTTMKATLKGK